MGMSSSSIAPRNLPAMASSSSCTPQILARKHNRPPSDLAAQQQSPPSHIPHASRDPGRASFVQSTRRRVRGSKCDTFGFSLIRRKKFDVLRARCLVQSCAEERVLMHDKDRHCARYPDETLTFLKLEKTMTVSPSLRTVPGLAAMTRTGEKIAMLTCYDASFAALLDRAGVDAMLVGDSLGMVIGGHASGSDGQA